MILPRNSFLFFLKRRPYPFHLALISLISDRLGTSNFAFELFGTTPDELSYAKYEIFLVSRQDIHEFPDALDEERFDSFPVFFFYWCFFSALFTLQRSMGE